MAQSQAQQFGKNQARNFDNVAAAADGRLPTRTDRQLAAEVKKLCRIRRVSWFAYSACITVKPKLDAELDRYLLDDVREIVESMARDSYKVVMNEDESVIYIQNQARDDKRLV